MSYDETKGSILTEGWEYLFFNYLDPTSPIGGIPGYGTIGRTALELISSANLEKIVNHPKMSKYFKKTCDQMLQKLKKETGNKTWTAKLPGGFVNAFKKMWHGSDELGFFHGSRWTNFRSTFWEDKFYHVNNFGYNITFFYDSDHIDAAVVLFYDQASDRIIGKRIPEPSKEDLRLIGFREEEL